VIEPSFYGSINIDSGKAILFMPRLDEVYATFMGELETLEDVKRKYDVDEVHYSDDVIF